MIDIVFQTGEFFNESNNLIDFLSQLISESVGAFIGAGAAILIFYRQNTRDKKREQENIKAKSNDDMSYASFLLDEIIYDQQKHIDYLEKYLSVCRANPGSQFKQLETIPLQNLIRLQRFIDDPETFNSFMFVYGRNNKENINKYRNITNSIDYLIQGNNQIQSLLEVAMPNDYNRRGIYNELSDKVIGEIKYTAKQYSPPANNILSVFDQYLAVDKPKEIDDHVKLIVMPLLNAIDELHESYSILKDLKDGLHGLLRLKDEIEFQNNLAFDKFDAGITDLKRVLEKLKSDSELIRTSSTIVKT